MEDRRGLSLAYHRGRIASLIAYSPFAAVFILTPAFPLSFFGPEFIGATVMLQAMAIGRLVNSSLGLTEPLLNMTGRARTELLSASASVAVLLGAGIPSTILYGAYGMAWAVAVAMAFRALFSWYFVRRVLLREAPKQLPTDLQSSGAKLSK
jgi:O-antigen/teichoic acid export membrane protein